MKDNLIKSIYMMSRYFLFGFMLQLIFSNFGLAITANGQYLGIEEVTVNISNEQLTIGQFFMKVQKQTPFKFSYDNKKVDRKELWTFSNINGTVEDFLIEASKQSTLSFRQVNNSIGVKKDEKKVVAVMKEEASIWISGTVVDENGDPIPGVTVSVQGASIGTITALDGNFSLEVQEGDILLFSFIGFQSEKIVVGSQDNYKIILRESQSSLDEFVVIGYGTVKKSDLTGSVSSISSDDLNRGANVSVDQMISGRAAGVVVSQTSAEPGGGMNIRIRGSGSVNAGNEPLYVIDGLPINNSPNIASEGRGVPQNNTPRNPLNSLNPNDIISVEILKDASATAIYGSRGANGVILITTKKGKEGKLNIDYDFYTGLQKTSNRLNLLNTQEYISVLNGIQASQNLPPVFNDIDIAEIGSGTDWQEQIFQTAKINNHNLSASGGSANTNYFISLNYFDQEGVVIGSGIKRYAARVNLEHKATDKFKFGINLNASYIEDNFTPYGISTNANSGVTTTSIQMPPIYPLYDAQGNLFQTNNIDLDNPVILANGIHSIEESDRTFGTIFGEYSFLPNLRVRVNFGSDRRFSRKDVYNSTITKQGRGAGGIASVINARNVSSLFEGTLHYNKDFNDHHFVVLGGYTFENFLFSNMAGAINGFPSDATITNNLSLGNTETDDLTSFKENNKLSSYIGRVNYDFKNKYLFTASLRVDGSSRFGENNKFAYFPSAAFAWRISDEAFIPEFFDDLKLRTSWGKTGNQAIGNFNSIATFGPGGAATLGGVSVRGMVPRRIPNPNLKWETTSQVDVGLDMSFFKGRINASVDYFNKNTTDVLLLLPIPSTSGFQFALQNIGSVNNRGFELELASRNIMNKSFEWTSNLNFATIRNKVTDLGPIPEILMGNLPFTPQVSIVKVGHPMNSYYGYEILGIFQNEEQVSNSAQPNSKPGNPIFNDINGDNVISSTDRTILGDPFPDFTFGFNNTFSHKGFELQVFFQGEYGAQILNQNMVETMNPIEAARNRYAEPWVNRWTPNNQSTRWPSGINPSSYGGGPLNSWSIEDASFIRLRSVELSYNLTLNSAKHMRSAKIYLTGQNLAVLTNYRGYDPEVNSFGNSNIRADYNSYPAARTFLLGINVGF